VELRVDARTVVALAVVLGDELPVRVDLVRLGVGDAEAGEVEPLQMRRQVAQPFVQWRRLRGEADEHEPLPRLHPDRHEAEVLALEVLEVLGVLGADEVAFEVVDPRVVRALEPNGLAAGLLDDGRAAMATHVVERAQRAVAAAGDDQRLVADLRKEVRAALGGVLLAADDHPVASEPDLALEVVDRGVVVRAAGQQRRRAIRLADRRDLVGGQRTRETVGGRARGHDFGTSFFGSRNGIAAVRACHRLPSGASTSSGVPAPASAIGIHTYPMFRSSRGDQMRSVTVPTCSPSWNARHFRDNSKGSASPSISMPMSLRSTPLTRISSRAALPM